MTEQKRTQMQEKKKKDVGMFGKIMIGLVLLNSLVLIFNFFAVPELKYRKALKLVEIQQYATAIDIFTELGDYKDSGAQLIPLYDILNSYVGVGATVYYGTYEQDNDNTNGKEKISWRVVATDQDKALLISEYNLDCLPYNLEDKAITWETCTLRSWLNSEFLNAAFTPDEQEAIITTKVETEDNSVYQTKGGAIVEDKLFLLSAQEAGQYFTDDLGRLAANTAYAMAKNAYSSPEGNGWWWLRTPGIEGSIASNVNYSGTVDEYGNYVYSIGGCVRPAFWIDQKNL